jgi:hypothetical protein
MRGNLFFCYNSPTRDLKRLCLACNTSGEMGHSVAQLVVVKLVHNESVQASLGVGAGTHHDCLLQSYERELVKSNDKPRII